MAAGYQGYQGYAGYGDPQRAQLDRKRQIAELLQQGVTDTSAKSLPEGIAQLGKAFIASQAQGRADQAESAYADTVTKRNAASLAALFPDQPPGVDFNPETQDTVQTPAAPNRFRSIAEALLPEMGLAGAIQAGQGVQRQDVEDQRYADTTAYARDRDVVMDQRAAQQAATQADQWGQDMDLQRNLFDETVRGNKVSEGIASAAAAAKAAEAGMPDFGDENSFRGQYLAQAKSFNDVKDAATRIRAVKQATTPAQQMALIYGYMKLLDPGTGVKEGEYASAADTTGIPGWITNAYNKAQKGIFLNPDQVSGFLEQADAQYKAAEQNYVSTVLNPYRAMAPRYRMDPSIIQDFRLKPEPSMAQQGINALGDAVKGIGGMFMPQGGARPQPQADDLDSLVNQWLK